MKIFEAKEQSRGVFWIVDNKLLAFPFINDSYGVSKSGLTYNHEKLWKELKVGKNIPYNYYPRGRVDFNGSGKPIIWMNPNIDEDGFISQIKTEFGLRENPKINYDFSDHYKCYLDDGWKPAKG